MERKTKRPINNAFYDDLGNMWNTANDHPIALLRAENALRNPWIQKVLEENNYSGAKVLDIGCGGGLLTNYLARKGHEVSGIDLSTKSLDIAKEFDQTKSALVDNLISFTLSGTDPEDDPLTWSASNLPSGAVFNVQTLRSASDERIPYQTTSPKVTG